MRRNDFIAGVLMVALLVSGCARTHAPSDWLDPAAEAQQNSFGGWARVMLADSTEIAGELIALGADTVFVLSGFGLTETPLDSVKWLRLAKYDSNADAMGAMTTLGTLSTLSHGIGLIVSAPVWIIFGSSLSAAQSRVPLEFTEQPRRDRDKLVPYARFPQGMPIGIDRASLRAKQTGF